MTSLTNYLVNDVHDRNLEGLRIRNTANVQYKVVGISFDAVTSLRLVSSGACCVKSFGAN